MCELMGLSFAKPICADFSLREFSGRGDENADGWGLGWYPDRSLAVVKEPLRWGESRLTQFLETYQGLVAPSISPTCAIAPSAANRPTPTRSPSTAS